MTINEQIRTFCEIKHVDYFSVADLTETHDSISTSCGTELISEYPRAISIGIKLFHDIVDQLSNRTEKASCVAYRHHCYDVINQRLDSISSELSSLLQRQNYRVYPVPASKRVCDEKIAAIFSHKMAAYLCGIGWIGKSCLLITPDAGPRVRFATILTDAPLQATGKPMEDQCGSCHLCVDMCPAGAFTGRAFSATETREVRYNAHTCENYFKQIQKVHDWAWCGMCVYVCPYGRKVEK